MKILNFNDIERLKTMAGYDEHPVVIPREDFEALVAGYKTRVTDCVTICCQHCDRELIVEFPYA